MAGYVNEVPGGAVRPRFLESMVRKRTLAKAGPSDDTTQHGGNLNPGL
jgi:hypothetical protein